MGVAPFPSSFWNIGILLYKQAKLRKYMQHSVLSYKTSDNFSGEGDHIMSVLEDSNREREELRQKCHELEIQVKLLTENKSIMTTELDNLQVQVKGKIEAESYR